MAPNPNNINNVGQILALFEDSHWTLPSAVDAQHFGIFSTFGCIVGIKNHGNTLLILTKSVNADGELCGFMTSTNPLPEDFEARWCRIFFRNGDALVLVMSVNRQDFIVYDVKTGCKEGAWTLNEPFPDGSWLMSVQSIDDESVFSLTYTFDNNEYSVECWYPGAVQVGHAA